MQVIKRDPKKGPVLQFGTEIGTDKQGTIAALLGASPGASTSPAIMLEVLKKAFPQRLASIWTPKIEAMILSYGRTLNDDPAFTNQIRRMTSAALSLPFVDVPAGVRAGAAAAPAPVATPPVRSLNREQQAM